MQTITVKRTKLFQLVKDRKKYRAVVPIGGPHNLPDWILDDITYQHGLLDGSITNLTPKVIVVVKEVDESEEPESDTEVINKVRTSLPAGDESHEAKVSEESEEPEPEGEELSDLDITEEPLDEHSKPKHKPPVAPKGLEANRKPKRHNY